MYEFLLRCTRPGFLGGSRTDQSQFQKDRHHTGHVVQLHNGGDGRRLCLLAASIGRDVRRRSDEPRSCALPGSVLVHVCGYSCLLRLRRLRRRLQDFKSLLPVRRKHSVLPIAALLPIIHSSLSSSGCNRGAINMMQPSVQSKSLCLLSFSFHTACQVPNSTHRWRPLARVRSRSPEGRAGQTGRLGGK